MGCGWDCTQHLLWRLDNSDLSHVSPKLAIVLIGTNNWSDPAAEVAAGIIAVCRRLRTALPGMKILLLAIFPRDHEPTELRAKNASASLLASEIADGEMIHSLDISALFLDDSGKLSADIMPDFLHPNETGYKIWAKAVEPVVKNLLGK
jgi:beta-glucosidase